MLALLVPSAFALPLLEGYDLWRVDDPNEPSALYRSSTGSVVLAGTVAGGRPESVAETDVVAPPPDDFPVLEALQVTNAATWHAAGIRGGGVKVAVFDIGWYAGDADPTQVDADGTADCLVSATCSSPLFQYEPLLTVENGQHGWACAETIRSVAPDVELWLVRAPSFTAFENAVAWAIREDVDLISLSVSYYNQSFYDGHGPYGELMDALAANGTLMVTSAGNNAREHWWGRALDVDLDGRLDLDGNNGLDVQLSAGTPSILVNWDEYDQCGDSDFDVALLDADRRVLGHTDRTQDPEDDGCLPNELLRPRVPEAGVYRLEVRRNAGSPSGPDIDILARSSVIVDGRPERSLSDPAVHPLVMAVGAVRASDYHDGLVEAFSAIGPTHGGLSKPDIVGPDGLSTAAFGPDGFYGTSASTPVVVGLLALLMSEEEGRTPFDARRRLEGYAIAPDPSLGPDDSVGAGRARLPVREKVLPVTCGHRPLVLSVFFGPMLWLPVARRLRVPTSARSSRGPKSGRPTGGVR